MTEAELQAFAFSIAQIAFLAGVVGGLAWTLIRDAISGVAELVTAWEERHMRIDQARMRHQHGPLLLAPRISHAGRLLALRVARARASAHEALARASERVGAVRTPSQH